MTAPTPRPPRIAVRPTTDADIAGIVALCRAVYRESPPWSAEQLLGHLEVFSEGQLVAVAETGTVVGMAASLRLRWADYQEQANWRAFTARGTFRNHDPAGPTLYGAEVMVHPDYQRRRIGQRLYRARRALARSLGVLRIRAGARLRGYHRHADQLSPEAYVRAVVRGELRDPTLTFQLREDFHVFAVVEGYLLHDPDSLGWAALIEWLNPDLPTPVPEPTYLS
ncbi:MAG: GNAT family N-acetyltransferase [Gemmatimonadales bacterium]